MNAVNLNDTTRHILPKGDRGFLNRAIAAAAVAAFILVATGTNSVAAKQDKGYGVETISTRADRVSGGNVLVRSLTNMTTAIIRSSSR